MAASAAYGMVLCGADELEHRYRGRIEKVKFGVPISEAFSHDIPATLLVLLLKVNKEGPLKKDIWRAPGNQAQVRKLSHIMQHGRLVNISNISVYTAASVIKRFLAKLPGGILGAENEKQMFDAAQQNLEEEQQRDLFCRIVAGLPLPSQHLLVLLFGTFRIITDSAETFGTRMTPDAIGISVAPSLFHTCIHDGQRAKLEDIMRFKLASQVISKIIQTFGYTNLFPRECYEFYARITGRTLRVDEQWHFSFQLPSRTLSQPSIRYERSQSPATHRRHTDSSELEQMPTTSKQAAAAIASGSEECEDEDVYGESLPELGRYAPHYRKRDQSKSIDDPTKVKWTGEELGGRRGGAREERLSTSMGEVVVHSEEESETFPSSKDHLESTRSLTYLEWVHERQTHRMKTRSEWFLSPSLPQKKNGGASRSDEFFRGNTRFSTSPEHLRLPKEEEGMLSSGDEEMCLSSEAGCSHGCAARSTDTSMKCSRPGSCCTSGSAGDAHMRSQTATEDSSDDDAFLAIGQYSPTKMQRQPFQVIQERQYSTSTTEGSASAQVTPSAVGPDVCAKNGRRFFGSGEQEGGLQALPEVVETSPQARRCSAPFVETTPPTETAPTSPVIEQEQQPLVAVKKIDAPQLTRALISSMSSGSSSGSGNGSSGTSAQTVIGIPQSETQQQQQTTTRGGVVRRRSWRTHYTRPKNKSLEYETGNVREEVPPSSQSTPLRKSPPTSVFSRRHSSNGESEGGSEQRIAGPSTSTSAREVLIRRKSSNGGGGTKSKPPVQIRRSTQI